MSKKQKEQAPDPELDEELMKVDRMSEAQIDTELKAMLVSDGLNQCTTVINGCALFRMT